MYNENAPHPTVDMITLNELQSQDDTVTFERARMIIQDAQNCIIDRIQYLQRMQQLEKRESSSDYEDAKKKFAGHSKAMSFRVQKKLTFKMSQEGREKEVQRPTNAIQEEDESVNTPTGNVHIMRLKSLLQNPTDPLSKRRTHTPGSIRRQQVPGPHGGAERNLQGAIHFESRQFAP